VRAVRFSANRADHRDTVNLAARAGSRVLHSVAIGTLAVDEHFA
jgi:hypothetical protein